MLASPAPRSAATASPSAAADDDPLVLGVENEATDTTTLTHAGDGPAGLRVESTNADNFAAIHGENAGEVGIRGVSSVTLNAAGVDGVANGTLSSGVRGTSDSMGVFGIGTDLGSFGVAGLGQEAFSFGTLGESPFIGAGGFSDDGFGIGGGTTTGTAAYLETEAGAHLFLLRLEGDGDPVIGPPPESGEGGTISLDSLGDLYLCTESGDPGVWTRLNDQTTFLDTPQRAVDSRDDGGAHAAGETRTIDLSAATDLPDTATSATITLSVTATTGAGFVSVYSAAAPTVTPPEFASLTWTTAGQTISTTIPVAVHTGQIKIYAHRATHVIVDVIAHQASRTRAMEQAAVARRHATDAQQPARRLVPSDRFGTR